MTHRARLGGFKILDEVVRISLTSDDEALHLPSECCRLLAEAGINLNFFSSVDQGPGWSVELIVNVRDAPGTLDLLSGLDPVPGRPVAKPMALLSVFPHRNDPAVLAGLLNALSLAGIRPKGLANSPSALSVVLDEETVDKAAEALFNPFQFSAYRTPSDWRLAQKGKEQLFKEVIASFQEARPKVYFLEYQENRELLQLNMPLAHMSALGAFFETLDDQNAGLGFLATGVNGARDALTALLVLPRAAARAGLRFAALRLPDAKARLRGPVAAFSMNGPHFGDRYGIAGELLNACRKNSVPLLGLACSIATVSGVVPSAYLQPAIEGITNRFEVPSVIKRD
jgi:aspartokinase